MKSKYLIYRGELCAVTSCGSELIFGTVHDEGQPTGVYFVDLETSKARKAEMPGAVALERDEEALYAAGVDGRLWRGELERAALEAVGEPFEGAPVALALVSGQKLAVAHGASVSIVSRADGTIHQRIALPERATCLAADRSGEWAGGGHRPRGGAGLSM